MFIGNICRIKAIEEKFESSCSVPVVGNPFYCNISSFLIYEKNKTQIQTH